MPKQAETGWGKDDPTPEEIYAFLKAVFLDFKITLDELQAYYLFLEVYFAPERSRTDSAFSDKTAIVELMCKRTEQMSMEQKNNQWSHNILYTKTRKPDAGTERMKFLLANRSYMFRLFTGLTEAELIVPLNRVVEFKLYPAMFSGVDKHRKHTTFQPMPSKKQMRAILPPLPEPEPLDDEMIAHLRKTMPELFENVDSRRPLSNTFKDALRKMIQISIRKEDKKKETKQLDPSKLRTRIVDARSFWDIDPRQAHKVLKLFFEPKYH